MLNPMLNVAIKAVRKASSMIQRNLENLNQIVVEKKSDYDLVSEVDRLSERVILDIIRSAYPDHSIKSEESGIVDNNSDYLWIVDPLDGTNNYLHSYPYYGISIAVAFKEQIIQAVVYDPNRDELFSASKGAGAFLNNRRIRCSSRTLLREALLGTSFQFRTDKEIGNHIEIFCLISEKCVSVRRAGAAALDLCYVAAGRLDGYWGFGLHDWDFGGGAFIAQEAGALIIDPSENDDWMKSGNILVANPKILAQIQFEIENFAKINKR